VTLKERLARLEVDLQSDAPATVARAVALARELQSRGNALQTPQERRQQREFERMMLSEQDKATLTQLTDQAFRSHRASRAADQLTHILDVQGVPRFFSTLDRAMLKGFQSFGSYLPGVAVPLVKDKMREETANVILPAEPELLAAHLEMRRKGGLRMNVNYLGEALLGEAHAERRLEAYLSALQQPWIECISVKISTIYSQISAIARERSIKVLCERLELLYRAAAKARYTRADGTEVPKFVYLDMEEYRDLSITVEALMRTLDRPGCEKVNAGIALQAYIPDSFAAQREINAWARRRADRGGSPVTIRIVKGANMEMELAQASIAGWPSATFQVKAESDANFKRMLHEAVLPENIRAVHVGVGSHNLFDVAYALVLASEHGIADMVQVEMLEGMANHQRRALSEIVDNVLLYAPATHKEDFIHAIGYLVRRMDENTGPDNFLRHAFKLEVDTDEWRALERDFVRSFELIEGLPDSPRRTQDRRKPVEGDGAPVSLADFDNEPDTDFSLPWNVEWAKGILERWRALQGDRAAQIPVVVGGEETFDGREVRECVDPSRPGVVVGRYRQANEDDLRRALECARADAHGWRTMSEDDRGAVLARAAQELRRGRADLMGAAACDGGKILTESDPEVSEAIDFVQYYAAAARYFRALPGVVATPRGVVVVVSPWNFPIAIPCGGIAAALASGNNVILKPASSTVLVAWELCKCFWRAGVPRAALQLMPCSGAGVGAGLVASPEVDVVILTGGTSTALAMLEARPEMALLAETGGKNATIVTGMSDRDQAIKHVLHSAFSHSGQKCSATSLFVLEAEVYDDPAFKRTLCDAIESLRVDSAWSLDTKVGPLIVSPTGDLERSLKELEEGESWAVMPHRHDENPNLWSPGLKWGVTPGSYTHMTEFFGPVLAVLRAEGLEHAIEITNQTGYGLTSGIETLDEREKEIWKAGVRAGNLYINRVTTGAVVHRQPFGGMGKSAFGPGIKAGGPNYVAQLMAFSDRADAPAEHRGPAANGDLEMLRVALLDAADSGDVGIDPGELRSATRAILSYDGYYAEEVGVEHDDMRLVGQDNVRRYLPVRELRVRVHPEDSAFELLARVCAAGTVGCRVTVSVPSELDTPALQLLDRLTEPWGATIEIVEESDEDLAEVIRMRHTDRIRYARPERVPVAIRRAVGDTGIYVADAPVLAHGRIELLWYVMEQSVSDDYHRYGNLGARTDEPRRSVP